MKTQRLAQDNPSQLKLILSLTAYFGVLIALFFASEYVFAGGQTIGKVAENVTETMTSVGKLISAASYVAGIGFALMGLLKLKAHKDQPQQVPLSQPIVLILIAVGLVFLPSIIDMGGETLFGSSKQAGSAKGEGVTGLD